MVWLAVLSFCGFAGYAALLPVVPLWVVVRGGSDAAGAGLVNFVLLAATVATQFAVPALIRRFGWAVVLAAGLVLLGAPALLLGATADLGPVLALSVVRGVGFGILTVAASAATVLLVEPARRGAAVGAYSLALALPNVLLMPTGSWAAEALGFWSVFLVGGLPLVGVPAAFVLARHLPERSTHAPGSAEEVVAPPSSPEVPTAPSTREVPTAPAAAPAASEPARLTTYLSLLAPTAILLSVTLAGGAIITFAPQMVAVPWLSAAGLFALGLTSTLARWRVGGLADRIGMGRLMWPFAVLIVVSLAGLAWLVHEPVGASQAVLWVLACGAVGVSYGALQNLTMLQAFAAAGPRRIGAASAVWNAGYDTGTALGALVVGALAVVLGFGWGMAFTAVICLLVLPLTLRARR